MKKDKKSYKKHMANPTLVDAGSVLILGQVDSKMSEKVSDRKLHQRKTGKKSTSSKTRFKEDLEALDSKWSDRLSCLEAFILAKTIQPVNQPQTVQSSGQPTFQHVVVSLVEHPQTGTVTSDQPFLPPTGPASTVTTFCH